MANDVGLREAGPGDTPTVCGILRDAFGRDGEARLAEDLARDGDAVITVLAQVAGRPVGCVLFSGLGGAPSALALAPVAVLPDQQGRGVGTALIRHGLDLAWERGWRSVFVLGEPAYYARFGFCATLAEGAGVPWAGPAFQALELQRDALRDFAGPLLYPAAFSRL